FHRIFKAMVGETLNQFIRRVRLEKAANLLLTNPRDSITEIALSCGFSSSAAFARDFKGAFGMSASAWRSGGSLEHSKICKANRRIREARFGSSMYSCLQTNATTWRIEVMESKGLTAEVEVRDLEECHVAYVRHIGAYQGDSSVFERMFTKLFSWAGPRGLLRFPETRVLSVYHDNPNLTDDDKLRTSMCITVPADTEVDGEVGKMAVPGGLYAVAKFELSVDQYQQAWDAVCGGWLPESGYQPDDRPCFEVCLNDPKDHPEGKHIVEICVPVKPL
ncbi:MAG: AraC family transcriptional regulator, partial [bacterium]|nr:AraC family transcriptional regulator [bacterium]